MMSTVRSTILYAMILVPGAMLLYTYPTWKMLLGLIAMAFAFQTAVMASSTLVEIGSGWVLP